MTKQRCRPTSPAVLPPVPVLLGPVPQQPVWQQPVQQARQASLGPLVQQVPQGALVPPPGPQVSPALLAALLEPQAVPGQGLPLALQAPAPGSPTV